MGTYFWPDPKTRSCYFQIPIEVAIPALNAQFRAGQVHGAHENSYPLSFHVSGDIQDITVVSVLAEGAEGS